jgi:hypothetical protein
LRTLGVSTPIAHNGYSLSKNKRARQLVATDLWWCYLQIHPFLICCPLSSLRNQLFRIPPVKKRWFGQDLRKAMGDPRPSIPRFVLIDWSMVPQYGYGFGANNWTWVDRFAFAQKGGTWDFDILITSVSSPAPPPPILSHTRPCCQTRSACVLVTRNAQLGRK